MGHSLGGVVGLVNLRGRVCVEDGWKTELRSVHMYRQDWSSLLEALLPTSSVTAAMDYTELQVGMPVLLVVLEDAPTGVQRTVCPQTSSCCLERCVRPRQDDLRYRATSKWTLQLLLHKGPRKDHGAVQQKGGPLHWIA